MTWMLAAVGRARRKAQSISTVCLSIGLPAVACATGSVVAAPAAPIIQAQPQAESRTITLITGDRVVLRTGAQFTAEFQPRAGREKIQIFSEHRLLKGSKTDHFYAIPSDALPLIAAGRLDRELFNLTALADSRYDDARSKELPLVITYQSQARALTANSASLPRASETHALQSVNGIGTRAVKANLGKFWDGFASHATSGAKLAAQSSGIRKIWLDRIYKPVLDRSVPQIGAPAAYQAGYDGAGVRVAVVDSGIDQTHPDLAGKVIAAKNFTTEADGDLVGHGTHVASTIAGSGAASNGAYHGVAPGAELLAAKVCAVNGCTTTDIIEGVQWAVVEQGAKIVNISLGSNDPDTVDIDPVEEAVNTLTAEYGTLFVIAAGNLALYDGDASISSPGSAAAALTVGAIDRDESLAYFSGLGPNPSDGSIKPEITAPGVDIVAALATGVVIGSPVNDFYTAASGTSMATPHVAGAAALLSQRHSEWAADQLKAALIGSAWKNPALSIFAQGAGRVDIANAFAVNTYVLPSVLSMGTASWPHADDEILTRTLTYHNDSSAALTLALSMDVKGPTGANPTAGMFSLSTTTLTVPAGGSAAATLTVNTRSNTTYGLFSGRVLATANGHSISTPLAITAEDERYDVTLNHIDSSGGAAESYSTTFIPLDQDIEFPVVEFIPGAVTARIPAGRYAVQTLFNGFPGCPDCGDTAIINSEVVIGGSGIRQLTIDQRAGTETNATVPVATAEQIHLEAGWEFTTTWGSVRYSLLTFADEAPLYLGFIGARQPAMNAYLSAQWADPGDAAQSKDPSHYGAAWIEHGTLATGMKAVPLDKATVVRASYVPSYSAQTNASVNLGVDVLTPNVGSWYRYWPVTLPYRRTEYYFASEKDVRWASYMASSIGNFDSYSQSLPPFRFIPGQVYFNHWNEPPFSPQLPNHNPGAVWSYREGNTIVLRAPLFGDKARHIGDTLRSHHHLTLYRNGVLLSEFDYPFVGVDVPPDAATYRLEAALKQEYVPLSTAINAAWTFQSAQTSDSTILPFMTLNLEPTLNAQGQAPRGKSFTLPITPYQTDQQGPVKIASLSLEVSFDDGATWKPASLVQKGSCYLASFQHPANAVFVSLRAKAQGLAGNAFEETLIRAYGLTD